MNPETEKVRRAVQLDLQIYGNLAPKLCLLFYVLSFFSLMSLGLVNTEAVDLDLSHVIMGSIFKSLPFAALGYLGGYMMGQRLQENQLKRLEVERDKRKQKLSEHLHKKRDELTQIEAMAA